MVRRNIQKEDSFFGTEIKIDFSLLKKFCEATLIDIFELKEENKYYIPGVMLISMLRHIVKKISENDGSFPIKKLQSFYGHNGGTKENRVYLCGHGLCDEIKLTYKLKYLSKMDGKPLYMIEICKKDDDSVVLNGIFSLI